MSEFRIADGATLGCDEVGTRTPVAFGHEFAAAENGRWLAHGPPSA